MPRIQSRSYSLRSRLLREDGFALIEVMVSAVLVVVLATATLSIIERAGAVASSDRSRAVATQLAQEDQDSMRLMKITSLSNYHVTHPPQKVDNIDYTVESQAEWMRDDSTGKVVCDGNTTRAEYAKITSKVTWARQTKPVILESYVAPGVKGVSLGSLAVKLHNDGTKGTPGITINFQGQSVSTDSDGCAIFTTLTPGMSNATWSGALFQPNFVDKNGNNSVTKSVTIAASQNSILDAMFDRAGTIPVRFVDDVGNNVKWNTVTAANSGMDNGGVRVFGKTTDPKLQSMDASTLFPFATAYTMYAGSCAGNAPATWDTSGSSSTIGQRIAPPGATAASVDVPLPDVAVGVRQNGSALNGASVSFAVGSHANMAGCVDKIGAGSSDAPTTAGGNGVVAQLPWGQYVACAPVGTNGSTTYYGRRTFFNTPSTTPAATGFGQTRDSPTSSPITLAAPYAGQVNKIATALINTNRNASTKVVTAADANTTVNTTACPS